MKKMEGKLLAKWLEQNNVSVSEMAVRTGITRQGVYYHLRKEEIDQSFKNKLSDAGYDILPLGVKSFYKTDMMGRPPAYLHQNLQPINLTEKAVMYVPLVNKYAYAGYLSGFGDSEYLHSLPALPMVADREGKGLYMAFEVKGDSMDDGTRNSYEPGDLIICRQIAQHLWQNKLHIHKYDFVIVHKTEGILLKKIVKHDTTECNITLHSLNPLFEDFSVNLDDVAQIFNVIKVEREK